MRTLAHISDLHFGRLDPPVTEALADDLAARSPDVIVVSGDLTQRARRRELADAGAYLARLPGAKVVVPGNHDVPLFDLPRRFLSPLTRFRALVEAEAMPVHSDDELMVIGLNTARSMTWKEGRVSVEQLELVERIAQGTDVPPMRAIVAHHPFVTAPGESRAGLVGRAEMALEVFERAGVSLIFSGHLHLSFAEDVGTYFPAKPRRSILAIHAGTATSVRRRRGQPNGYNLVGIDGDTVEITVMEWRGDHFRESVSTMYRRIDGQWRVAAGAMPSEVIPGERDQGRAPGPSG